MPKGCSLDLSQLNRGEWVAVSNGNELTCFNVCYANLVDKNLINCGVLNLVPGEQPQAPLMGPVTCVAFKELLACTIPW